ncbi:Hypothetical predicted protein [Octopus vulgaris]|uniref:Uncharacterized protein n=1 Tax=Octopus vulgaris TaxID=6645 RepID=A0AA36FDX7_OCTVU|nr:Hypothetical predicted protein [Octopus vulgaris]
MGTKWLKNTDQERPIGKKLLKTTGQESPIGKKWLKTAGKERPICNKWLKATGQERSIGKTKLPIRNIHFLCQWDIVLPLLLTISDDS